jgi:hypothetical protein
MNTFKFHSVGQGLFYTGSIADGGLNFVYDCGTESSQEFINKAVDTGETVSKVVATGSKLYNQFANLYNTFGEGDPLPRIGNDKDRKKKNNDSDD